MKNTIKNFLKKHFLYYKIRDRFNPSVQINQRQMFLSYQQRAKSNDLPLIKDTGFRVFSQFEEDGMLLYLFSLIGMTNKTFLEIGSDDGVNSNSANLYFNFDWHGIFIDGNSKSIKRGIKFYNKHPHTWTYKPNFICSLVTKENINALIKKGGLEGEIGLLSIDIDGNDYHIWDAIEQVSPQVVIIETQIAYGMNNIVVPYNPNYVHPGKHPDYCGASPVAMQKLGKKKGYRLVGANALGFNFIFVKNGLVEEFIPEVSVESVLSHPSAIDGLKKYDAVKGFEFIEG